MVNHTTDCFHRKRVTLALGYYDHQLHRGIARFARDAGWILDTSHAHYGQLPFEWQADGIITLLCSNQHELIKFVSQAECPVVDLTSNIQHDFHRVLLDNKNIGLTGAQHLIDRNYKKLIFVQRTNSYDVGLRREGFLAAAKKASIHATTLNWSQSSDKNSSTLYIPWLLKQLKSLNEPTGIMAQSDNCCVQVMTACEMLNLRIPEDIGIIGPDNDNLVYEFAPVRLSTVISAREELAFQGAKKLNMLMIGQEPECKTTVVPIQGIAARDSTDTLATEDQTISHVIRYIRDNAHKPITAQDIVNNSTLSRTTLYRVFQSRFKRTISDEITYQRLNHACELLTRTDEKLYKIAVDCGFSGPEQLCRVFARKMGTSPGAYRQARRHC